MTDTHGDNDIDKDEQEEQTHLMIRMMGVMRMTDTLNDEGEQNRAYLRLLTSPNISLQEANWIFAAEKI